MFKQETKDQFVEIADRMRPVVRREQRKYAVVSAITDVFGATEARRQFAADGVVNVIGALLGTVIEVKKDQRRKRELAARLAAKQDRLKAGQQ